MSRIILKKLILCNKFINIIEKDHAKNHFFIIKAYDIILINNGKRRAL
jgi:hypothetical protein